jgi:hypothetical protein
LKGGKIPIEGTGGRTETTQVINYVTMTDPQNFVRVYGPIVKRLSDASAAESQRFMRKSR